MGLRKVFSGWRLAAIALIFIIAAGGFIICRGHGGNAPLELVFDPVTVYEGDIYVGGGVAVPGYYPVRPGDSIDDILGAAGGATGGPVKLELFPAQTGEAPAQRVDINTAEAWLLCALPGIGETRASGIVSYREEHGRFRDIDELAKVDGIGPALLDDIRGLVTVGE